tara:strand:+ start:1888 stop:2847 length:960 start_codon:yes stop_codon:yes gene_type:complete
VKIFKDLKKTYNFTKDSILIIGNLDGVHKGHQSIISLAKKLSKKKDAKVGVLLFDPHPRRYFEKDNKGFLLTQVDTRLEILKSYKIDYAIVLKFNKSIATMTPKLFCKKILFSGIAMKNIFVGKNFRFGNKRSGDYRFLSNFGKEHSFNVTPINLVKTNKILHKKTKMKIYSSSNIRALIQKGEVKLANKFLGVPFTIVSRVMKGDQRGRTIGVPTANLKIDEYIQPNHGVYAVRAKVMNKSAKGKNYKGIANFGVRPTFDKNKPLLEVHLFNFNLNIYNSSLKVEFIDFIRKEKKFSGIDSLKNQLIIDISKAKKILN